MCSPLAGLALGIGGGLLAMQQTSAQAAKNRQAQEQWYKFQQEKRRAEQARQDEWRKRAEDARRGAEGDLMPEQQKQNQIEEAARLNQEMQAPPQEAAMPSSNELISGQQNADATTVGDVSKRVSDAVASARSRIQNLAGLSSWQDSSNSMFRTGNRTLTNSGNWIDAWNNMRGGSLQAYQLEKAVSPKVYPDQTLLGQIGQGMAGMLGGGAKMTGFYGY